MKPPDKGALFYKGDLKNLGKFTGKRLFRSHFLNKVSGLQLYLKKRLRHRRFPLNFPKHFKNTFFYRTPSGDCF